MKLIVDTDQKRAALIDGVITVTVAPISGGTESAEFDALMTDLQPVIDQHFPIDAAVKSAKDDVTRQAAIIVAKDAEIQELRFRLAAAEESPGQP